MITLCGSTYAKFVCSIILKQPSYILMCSSFIEFKLQAHSILESKNDKIKVTKKGKIKITKIGYFFDIEK